MPSHLCWIQLCKLPLLAGGRPSQQAKPDCLQWTQAGKFHSGLFHQPGRAARSSRDSRVVRSVAHTSSNPARWRLRRLLFPTLAIALAHHRVSGTGGRESPVGNKRLTYPVSVCALASFQLTRWSRERQRSQCLTVREQKENERGRDGERENARTNQQKLSTFCCVERKTRGCVVLVVDARVAPVCRCAVSILIRLPVATVVAHNVIIKLAKILVADIQVTLQLRTKPLLIIDTSNYRVEAQFLFQNPNKPQL